MPTVLVTGATGAQGGSVARHLLERRRYSVRCLTRNPESEKARALAATGAEVVRGELDDLESLRAAVRGCQGVFGLTNYWEHFDRERQHGQNLIDAVAEARVEHFVFSTLPGAKKLTGLEVPHLDIKADLEDQTRARGLPATFVHVAFYFENFLSFFPPRKQAGGTYGFGFPQGDTPLGAVAAEDVGGVVAALFDGPTAFLGKTVGIVGDVRPPAEYARIMTRVLGKEIRYQHVPREVFAGLGFPGADDLANMFEFFRRYMVNRWEPAMAESRRIYPEMQAFEPWLRRHAAAFAPLLSA